MSNSKIIKPIKNILYKLSRLPEYTSSLRFLKKRNEIIHYVAPYSRLDDKSWLEFYFRKHFGFRLDFRNPKTFNEKMQWIKVYDRNPIYQQLSDKFLVRDFVKEKIGTQFLNPLIACYDDPKKIEWSKLPPKFVIKPNHGAGWIIINDGKGYFDNEAATQKCIEWLDTDFYEIYREWQYKHIPRRILIEELISTTSPHGLVDYKFFCFDGDPQIVQVNIDRFSNFSLKFMDLDWKDLQISLEHYPHSNKEIPKPGNLQSMREIAATLSSGLKFCRVDLYDVDGKIIFGEMTFTPNAGVKKFDPPEFDRRLGDLIDMKGKSHIS